jgi:pimeloyl-ACP methyl ester carboxylesterase
MTGFSSLCTKIDGILISYWFRKGSDTSIVLIHGLGASKNDFQEAFRRKELEPYSILAVDLVGFGDSDKPSNFSYSMVDQARILGVIMNQLNIERFHVLGHSMGGIVGVELCEMMPNSVCSFINAEGNLAFEDCTGSLSIAKTSEPEFVREGFKLFKQRIEEEYEKTGFESLRNYLNMLSKTTAQSVHRSSIATVQASKYDNLFKRFCAFPFYKCYVYGAMNRGIFPTEEMLQKQNIPIFYISRSAHAMMNDNPEEFYTLVQQVIQRNSKDIG